MSLNANQTGGRKTTIPPMEPGPYPARLRGVINSGLQAQRPFKGQEKPPAQELILLYEFPEEFLLDEDGQPDESKPRNLSERMPFFSLASERAISTQRYKALDPQELHGGDWASLVTKPCTVTVVTTPGKNGTEWNNVAGVTGIRKSQADKLPPLVNAPIVFDFYSPDITEWEKLPNWIKKRCQESLEYKGSVLEALLAGTFTYADGSTETEKPVVGIDEDEAPF